MSKTRYLWRLRVRAFNVLAEPLPDIRCPVESFGRLAARRFYARRAINRVARELRRPPLMRRQLASDRAPRWAGVA